MTLVRYSSFILLLAISGCTFIIGSPRESNDMGIGGTDLGQPDLGEIKPPGSDLSVSSISDLAIPPGSDLAIPPNSDLAIPPNSDFAISVLDLALPSNLDLASGPADFSTCGCTLPQVCCNGKCVDTTTAANCGGCGITCASGLCGNTIGTDTLPLEPSWSLTGSATDNTSLDGTIVLTTSAGHQSGSFIYSRPITTDNFNVSFEFKITPNANPANRGDGMGFMIEKNGSHALGNGGGGLGMTGLDGYGVELDLFNNAYPPNAGNGCGDADNNHVSVDSLTACLDWNHNAIPTTIPPPSGDLRNRTPSIDLADGAWHSCVIRKTTGFVSVLIDGGLVVGGIQLPGFQPGEQYYFGFAGATGDFANQQTIRNVHINFPTPRCL
jgi:hypothetical protein